MPEPPIDIPPLDVKVKASFVDGTRPWVKFLEKRSELFQLKEELKTTRRTLRFAIQLSGENMRRYRRRERWWIALSAVMAAAHAYAVWGVFGS